MKRDDIIRLPHPSLRQKSLKVSNFDDDLKELASDMESATLDWEDHREHELGVALAAVQINRLQKVIVIRNNFEDKTDRTFLTLINPKIIRTDGEMVTDYEGCLSVPDLYGLVPRYPLIKIKAQDIDGQEFRLNAEGFLARVLQHEIDHTHGHMFVDHIRGQRNGFYNLNEEGKLMPVAYEQLQTDILWH